MFSEKTKAAALNFEEGAKALGNTIPADIARVAFNMAVENYAAGAGTNYHAATVVTLLGHRLMAATE